VKVIGVIDLLKGRAVHAVAGRRDAYQPVAEAAGSLIAGDPVALARLYVDAIGIEDLYVADLDAILTRGCRDQEDIIRSIVRIGAPVWLDAGATTAEEAARVLDLGCSRLVIGLETLTGFQVLEAICDEIGAERVAFSLDLRNGTPIRLAHADRARIDADETAADVAARAAALGVTTTIVLDLARMGTNRGVDVDLMREVRQAAPRMFMLAGGGVREPEDLRALSGIGFDGALVATALHAGRIGNSDVAAARGITPAAERIA